MSKQSSSSVHNQFDFLYQIVLSGDASVGKTALLNRLANPCSKWDEADYVSTIGVDFVKKLMSVNGKNVMLQSWDTAGQERFRSITMAYYRGAAGAIICYDCTVPETLTSAETWIRDFKERSAADTPVILVACKSDLLTADHKHHISGDAEEQKQVPSSPVIEESKGEVWQQDQMVLNASVDVRKESQSGIMINKNDSNSDQNAQNGSDETSSATRPDLIAGGQQLATKMGVSFEVTSAKSGENVEQTFQHMTRLILLKKGHLMYDDFMKGSVKLNDETQQLAQKKQQKSSGCCSSSSKQ